MAGSIEAVGNAKDQDLLIEHGYSGYPIKVAYSNGERKYTYITDVGQLYVGDKKWHYKSEAVIGRAGSTVAYNQTWLWSISEGSEDILFRIKHISQEDIQFEGLTPAKVVLKLEQWSGRNGKLPAPAIFGLSKSQKPFYRPATAALVAVPPVQAPSPPGGAIPELVAQWKATEVCGNWQHFNEEFGPHIFICLDRQGQPTRRIEMDDRGCFKIFIVALLCSSLDFSLSRVETPTQLQGILNKVENLSVCEGITDRVKYEALSSHRGGLFLGPGPKSVRLPVARVHDTPFETGGKQFTWAIRHHTCELLVPADGTYSTCKSCRKYEKDSLRHLNRRHADTGGVLESSRLGHDALLNQHSQLRRKYATDKFRSAQREVYSTILHTALESQRLNIRVNIRNGHLICTMQAVLEAKVAELHDELLELSGPQEDAMVSLFQHCNSTGETPDEYDAMAVLWGQQQEALERVKNNKMTGMRWHPLVIKWCLRVKLKSPGAYEEMGKSGVLILPSARLLKSYTQTVEQHSGIVQAHMQRVEESASKLVGHQRNLILLFDEMKVSAGVAWSVRTGQLVGLVDPNDVLDDVYDEGLTLADKVLQFMARSITTSWSMPVAYFTYRTAGHARLLQVFPKVVSALAAIDLDVRVSVCDGAGENRRFMKCMMATCQPVTSRDIFENSFFWSHYTKSGVRRRIFFMADPSHLIKKLRNLLLSSWPGKGTRVLKKEGLEILWTHIKDLYLEDSQNIIKECRTLTRESVFEGDSGSANWAKMRVFLALGVLNVNVADALDKRVEEGRQELEQTALYVRKCARIFAIFNDHSAFHSTDDPRLQELRELVAWFEDWVSTVEARTDLRPSVRDTMRPHDKTVFDLVLAERGFVGFLADFKAEYPDCYVIPHLFSQDGLENFFGQVRGVGSQHTAPTCHEYGGRVNKVIAGGFVKQVAKGNTSGIGKTGLNYAMELERYDSRKEGHHASFKFSGA